MIGSKKGINTGDCHSERSEESQTIKPGVYPEPKTEILPFGQDDKLDFLRNPHQGTVKKSK
jgi:hypothetical protein